MLRMTSVTILAIAALLVLASCQPQNTPQAEPSPAGASPASQGASSSPVVLDDLPIRRVVLYQNGVGYFEREGEIESDEITLQIRPDQINDILKSLTILDLDNKGKAVSISLPVEKGAADAMAALPAQIQNDGGLLTLLRTFRGARVTLRTTEGDQVGRVTGLESIPLYNDQGQQVAGWRVMLRRESGAIDVIDVEQILGLQLQDRTLEVGLEKSLDISLNEGSWKPIELKIRLDAAVKRRVRVSYITEMPVWKPAYRLVVDASGKGLFQGWAVVDNVSGGDWLKISLSLVAGNPTSFLYNLYEPQFVRRPDLSGRVKYSALAPPKVESVSMSAAELAALQQFGVKNNNNNNLGISNIGPGGSTSGKGGGGYGAEAGGGINERGQKTPRLKPGRFQSSGSFDKKIIKRVVSRHKRKITHCYERQMRKNPGLRGRVTIQWRISPTGRVEGVSVASNEMGDPAVARCLRDAIQAWRFPSPTGGGYVEVKYPFNFDDGSGGSFERGEADRETFEGSFGESAEGEALSVLFEYRIKSDGGMTIKDRSSALVNLVQAERTAKEIVIFQPQPGRSYTALNPYRAIEFHNGSEQPLEPGPISLYRVADRDATFIGESFLEKTERDEKAFFTFALDPRIELETSELEETVRDEIETIRDGLLTTQVRRVNTVTYTLKNKGDEAIEAIISRPRRVAWETRVSDGAVLEEASRVFYIRQSIPAKGEIKVTFTESRTSPRTMHLSTHDAMSYLQVQLSSEPSDPILAAALSAVLKKRAEVHALEDAIEVARARRYEHEAIQRLNAELLQPLKDINNATSNRLKQQYIRDMNSALVTVVKARAEIAEREKSLEVERAALIELYDAVEFGEGKK